MEQEKKNKGIVPILVCIIVVLVILCALFATGTISFMSQKEDNTINDNNQTIENNDSIVNNVTIVISNIPNDTESYTRTIMTQNGNETLFANEKEIKLGDKQIVKPGDSSGYVEQVSIYNDIIITFQNFSLASSIIIYDLLGNEIKTISLFSDEQGRVFIAYPRYSQDEIFNLSNDGIITFVGTKHMQGLANTYIDNGGNTIDLCTQGENINDSDIVSGIFKISYLGNNLFSDISYVSTKSTVKDIKSCN